MLGLIWAQARNGAIGRDGSMPWHVPEDMRFFRNATVNHPVIMGRKTWESLEERFRPLPRRFNIVITHNRDFSVPGAITTQSIDDAIKEAQRHSDADTLSWVMGGAQIYKLAEPKASIAVVTELDLVIDHADAYAPALDQPNPQDWQLCRQLPISGWYSSRTGVKFRLQVYTRPHVQVPHTLSALLDELRTESRSQEPLNG